MRSTVMIAVLVCVLVEIFGGCKKFVDIDPPAEIIESGAIFEEESTALSAVSGVYVLMRNPNFTISNGGMSVYAGLSADDIYNTASSPITDPFTQNSLLKENNTVRTSFWNPSYKQIYAVNSVIEGVEKSKGLSDSIKLQFDGEMKVVRAFDYFNLVNLFGDVPLVLTTDYTKNLRLAREEKQKVYDQIIADLTLASVKLKETYASAGKLRPNKWTATALLARVYLFQGKWTLAEAAASAVIGSGKYSLVNNLAQVFLINSSETIWELGNTGNTAEGGTFIPTSSTSRPTYALTPGLLLAFEAGDKRKVSWVSKNTVSGQDYYYPFKYKVKSLTPVSEYLVVLRLAEQYLIRAEARLEQGNNSGARDDLNQVRLRAGLTATSSNDAAVLKDLIRKEKRMEFFAEWGHRWLDLKRTGEVQVVMPLIKGSNWDPTDVLYPIPETERLLNPALTQNPGY